MTPIKVLIADDHAMVREGLRQLLEPQADIEVVGEASDGVEALDLVRSLRPNILVLDLAMPRMNGLEAVKLIRDAVPETQIVILSMHEKEAYAHKVLSAGARGYVLKGEPSSTLLAAIRSVHEGEFFLSQNIRADVINSYVKSRKKETTSKGYDLLSEREQQVFLLLAEGNSTTQISEVLCISSKTVEKHRANITKKLGISTPIEMIKYAIRIGVIDPDFWTP